MKTATDRLKAYFEQEKKFNEHLKRAGMSRIEADCLIYIGIRRELDGQIEIDVGDVFHELSYFSSSGLSNVLSNQWKAGLLDKKINPENQRSKLVSLTAEGLAKYKELEAFFGETSIGGAQ